MYFNKCYARAFILLSWLLLTGFENFGCSKANDSDSGSGTTDTLLRVGSEQKISATSGNFNGNLDDGDRFGSAIADIGDLEADGVRDLVVGTPFNDDGGSDRGAVWVLFMDSDGQVDQEQKISGNAGGFGGNLNDGDLFGSAVAGIGDLDGDGTFDLAVGAPGGDRGGTDRGEFWLLFLDIGGKVLQEQRIADGTGGFDGRLNDDDRFGSAIADLGDVNGDGIRDLAVGAPNDDDGRDNAGAVWILFMGVDGKVASSQKISRRVGGFAGRLNVDDHFGAAVVGVGDLDNDGTPDLVVGAPGGDVRGTDRGEVWVLFLDTGGRVRQEQKIADSTGGFRGNLGDADSFGSAIADIGDMNTDGISDLAVGAPNDDDGADNAGALWILFMERDGRVNGWQKVSDSAGGFGGNLKANDNFGAAIAGTGNLDSGGLDDLVAGSPGEGSAGVDKGAIWTLFMERSN